MRSCPRSETQGRDVVVCPPFTALSAARRALSATARCGLRPRTCTKMTLARSPARCQHGCCSALGVDAVILGHSERRAYFAETDLALARKLPTALAATSQPILCVGESDAEREAGEMEAVLRRQLTADLAGLGDDDLASIVIAYEPIWAIGTGKTASAEQAEEAIGFIRSLIAGRDPTRPLKRSGSSTGVRLSRTTPPSFLRSMRSTARSSVVPSLDARRLPGDRPRSMSLLAGPGWQARWIARFGDSRRLGLVARRARQRGFAGFHAGL